MAVPNTSSNSPPSLGSRIAARATNLLATGVVVMAALVFGRQVMQWWDRPAGPKPEKAGTYAATAATGDWFEFGDATAGMRRELHTGTAASALGELRAGCREACSQPIVASHRPGPAETKLLLRLDREEPIERETGRWAMYQLQEPLPMVVAVAELMRPNGADSLVGEARRRVISWGLAFPSSARPAVDRRQWMLFWWTAETPRGGDVAVLEPPIPPRARRLVVLRSPDGSACAVGGSGRIAQWHDFFDRWHLERGWNASRSWQEHDESSHRHYEHATLGAVDVQVFMTHEQELRGFWIHTRKSTNAEN